MRPGLGTHVKLMLIGLLLAKVLVSIYYFSGTIKIPDLFLSGKPALAQDDSSEMTTDEAGEAADDQNSELPAVSETGTPDPSDAEAEISPEAGGNASDEIRMTLEGLEKKRLEIQEAEKRVQENERRLEAIKQEIEEKIELLSKIHQQVEEKLTRVEKIESEEMRLRREAEERRIKQLLKIYSSMKPKDFVPIMSKLDFDDAMKIIERMKSEQIGKILLNVDKDLAVKISNQIIADEDRENGGM